MWSTKTKIFGMPLLSAGFFARGFIAVGFSGVGVITIAQFGVGIISITQFGLGIFCVAQFALGFFTLAQGGIGAILAVGQGALGFAAIGFDSGVGFFVVHDPKSIWDGIRILFFTIREDPVFFILWSSFWISSFLFFFLQADKFSGTWKLYDFFVPRKSHTSPEVRKKALQTIHDPDNLYRIIQKDPDNSVREMALEKIHDEKLLMTILMDHACAGIHRAAVLKIAREDLLTEIALKSDNPDIADEVVTRIHNQENLKEITRHGERSRFRAAALARLVSPEQDYLHEIALKEESKRVLFPLISMTRKMDTLLHIIKNSKSSEIRLAAAKKLTPEDQKKAALLMITEKDQKIITSLAGIISDRDILKDIALHAEAPAAQIAALLCLKDTDTPFLLDFVKTSQDSEIREAALRPVTDQKILRDISLGPYGTPLALQALHKIDNREILKEIKTLASDEQIRLEAEKRIKSVMPIYYRFTVEFSCPSCSQPVFLNGPLVKTQCTNCLRWTELDTEFWKKVMESGFGIERHLTFHDLTIERTDHSPGCLKCGGNLSADDVPADFDGVISCTGCGEKNPVFPVPESFQWIPHSELIFCGERQGEEEKAAAEMKPVAISCIKCGAPLTVTAETPRNATCTYCNTLQYLPDGLWLSLHPVKTKHPWYLRMGYAERENLQKLKRG